MAMELLRFKGGFKSEAPSRLLVDPREFSAFLAGENLQLPAVYVLDTDDLDQLLADDPDLMIDRGSRPKGDRYHLSRYFLDQLRPVALRGSFGSDGTLRNAVFRFLQTAKRNREQNLYFLGTGASILRDLGEGAPLVGASPLPIIERMLSRLPPEVTPAHLMNRIRGRSPQVRLERKLAIHAARMVDPERNPILILGETGTGKGLVARQIHDLRFSGRRPFITVNCGAIPSELLESELFGVVAGTATGVVAKPGKWKEAHGGTLFLDEIADMSLKLQAKILHVLQDLKFTPVGGAHSTEVTSTAVVLAATNRNLVQLVEDGAFREDLYFRLNKFLVPTFPLREMPGDIEVLIDEFWLDKTNPLPKAVVDELCAYRWPGNVRELKSVLNGLAEFYGSTRVTLEDLRNYWEFKGLFGLGTPGGRRRLDDGHALTVMSNLHRAKSALEACRESFRDTFNRRKNRMPLETLHNSVGLHLIRISYLCRHPEDLGSEPIYRRLQGVLELLHKLSVVITPAADADRTRKFWKQDLEQPLETLLEALIRERESVLDGICGGP